jgi:hypothetical protein
MKKEIIDKLDEITKLIDNDKELIEYKKIKEKILKDEELLNKISKLKTIDSYSDEYVRLKKEILANKNYLKYIELEKKLFFDIKDLNNELNKLLEKRGCI